MSSSNSTLKAYEFALDLQCPAVVWANGGFPSSTHDITVFRGGKNKEKHKWDKKDLYFQVPKIKIGVGDSGYAGEPSNITITRPEHSKSFKKFLARDKSQQETFHTRLKGFNIPKHRFRHGTCGVHAKIDLHGMVVEAICVIFKITRMATQHSVCN